MTPGFSVPNEIVSISTPASLHSFAGPSTSRPTFSRPSDNSTMRLGGGPSTPFSSKLICSTDANAAASTSPVAVDSRSFICSIPRNVGSRNVVGVTSTVAVPAKVTRPRFT